MNIDFSFKKIAKLMALITLIFFQSCSDDPQPEIRPGESGFFVVNEGGFGNGNTSISFFDRKAKSMTNNIFAAKNGRPLGDQSQSMTVFGNYGYIVVQNSSKIEVIDASDFSSIATITDLPNPRYFIGISSTKGYVSDWGADGITGTVKVIDLNTYKVTKTVATGKGANRMLKVGNLVYVANAGGYDKDNTVKVMDANTDQIVASVTTGDNPNSLQKDKDGNIWVTSSGALAYNADFSINEANSTKGSISKIAVNNMETMRLTVNKVSYNGPANLEISTDGMKLYYTYDNAIYALSTTSTSLSTNPFIAKNYYGLSVDPYNGDVIGCMAPNFSSSGSIDVYNQAGDLQNSYAVGIGPNGCAFK